MRGRAEGREGIRAFFIKASGRLPFVVHMAMNPIIEVDGDTANGIWCLFQPCTYAEVGNLFRRGVPAHGWNDLGCGRICWRMSMACFSPNKTIAKPSLHHQSLLRITLGVFPRQGMAQGTPFDRLIIGWTGK